MHSVGVTQFFTLDREAVTGSGELTEQTRPGLPICGQFGCFMHSDYEQ